MEAGIGAPQRRGQGGARGHRGAQAGRSGPAPQEPAGQGRPGPAGGPEGLRQVFQPSSG